MITQSSIPFISHLLNEPQAIPGADKDQAALLVKTYPYFQPARYIEAAIQHTQEPFEPVTMANMELYMGNRLSFWRYMDEALGHDAVPETTRQYQQASVTPPPATHITPPPPPVFAAEERNETVLPPIAEKELASYDIEEELLYDMGQQKKTAPETEEPLILPIYTEDYFLHQGVEVSNDLPDHIEQVKETHIRQEDTEDKSLMVVMSFTEWLSFFKTRSHMQQEEEADQKAVKTMWQKEKLSAALEEENEEIPEAVFQMAMNSITNEEDLISEPLAEIYITQGKYDKAIDMYKKLSLRNPQKNAYFARKIEAVLKDKQS